uniref:Uncharacterized protein LOC111120061 n=1 Tax=Crassostrea virginica TaxID=6565 RepID=A0A8B8CPS3_CRAVI|nr:uncharacterized protein LOC111120061 [Crassostrea virginica]
MRTEDYSANTALLMRRVFDFLDLRHLEEEELKKLNITTPKRVHVTKHKLGKEPMMTKTRAMLDDFYRSDTEKLSRLLNDEQYSGKARVMTAELWEILRHSRTTQMNLSVTNKFKRAYRDHRYMRRLI